MKLMIFSGTTEGHELCRFLSLHGVPAEVFVATEYGAAVMEPLDGIRVHEGRLDEREIAAYLTADTLLIDATHPYAAAVTDNLRTACAAAGARYERLLRPALPYQEGETVPDTAAAVDWLNAHPGRVLLTTGSKELEAYTAVRDYRERLFPRVLPTASVLEKCAALGIPGAHIIAMQGPFSQAMNTALLRETGADILVTKDTGASGGFAEKLAAARETGATVLVIARPREENGRSQAEMQAFLTELLGLEHKSAPRTFVLVGAGMGTADTLTGEAVRALEAADAVFATERLAALSPKAEICAFSELAERAIGCAASRVALLVSGDVSFFSAAGRLRERLAEHGAVQLVPGLSSMQVLCAKCGVSYEKLCIRSLHGRTGSILGAVAYHAQTLVLTGGANNAQTVCQSLAEAGLGGVTVHLGENLGAENERMVHGTAAELAEHTCGDLAVLLIENPGAADADAPVRDESLTRGKVPMTKEEVRWVSVSRLAVQPSDTVWDVGAGTGAVTLELARKASDGMVYAIERKPEAVALLHENRVKLGGFNVRIVEGFAPQALENLPAPDCVFVGGSGGAMREILALAKEKNPNVRVVVNAIALETLFAAQTALQELGFAEIEVTQLAATRGRAVGAYTMLTANNPVFILSGRGSDAAK